MKKNSKIILPLMIASFALAGCGPKDDSPEFEFTEKMIASTAVVKSSYIEIKDLNLEVGVGASKQIEITSIPDSVKTLGVTFSSSDEEVAKVSEAGVVEGVKEGSARITVASKDGKFKTPVNVYVQSEITGDDLEARISDINDLYDDQTGKINKFALHEFSMEKYYQNDVLRHGYSSVEDMHFDGENGYFMIESTDLTTKVENDPGEIATGTWIFAVLSPFSTRMIHITKNAKNYVDFSTGDYRNKENYQQVILYDILDTFFVAGSEIITDQISYMNGAQYFPSSGEDIATKAYSFGANTLSFNDNASWTNQVTTAPDEILHNSEIPAGTITNDQQVTELHYEGDRCKGLDIQVLSKYELNGKNMKREFVRNMIYDDEFEVYEHTYKDAEEMKELGFKEVKDMFEL